MDTFIDGVKQDLLDLRSETRAIQAPSVQSHAADQQTQRDFFLLDNVAQGFLTPSDFLHGQEPLLSSFDGNPDANFEHDLTMPDVNVLNPWEASPIGQSMRTDVTQLSSAHPSHEPPAMNLLPQHGGHEIGSTSECATRPELRYHHTTLENFAVDTTNASSMEIAHMGDTADQQSVLLSTLMGINFEAVAGQTVFEEFCSAVQYIRGNETLKLPAAGSQISTVLSFLEAVQGAEFACDLYRRMGLWRLNRSYKQLQKQFHGERATMTATEKRIAKTGKSTSQALDVLLQTSEQPATRHNNTFPAEEQRKTRMHNFLSSSRSWSILCESASSGILCMIPQVAPSR